MLLHPAPPSRMRRLGGLTLIACLLAASMSHANRLQPIAGTISLGCNSTTLLAPWSGGDSLSCQLSTTEAASVDVTLACEDVPPGVTCTVSPPSVQPLAGTPAVVALTVRYAET